MCFVCFDLPISEVLDILGDRGLQHWEHILSRWNSTIFFKMKSKYSLENVTRSDYRELANLVNKVFVDMFGNPSAGNDTQGIYDVSIYWVDSILKHTFR